MSVSKPTGQRLLVLGGPKIGAHERLGWHATQLRNAAEKTGCSLQFATYESLAAKIGDCDGEAAVRQGETEFCSDLGDVTGFDRILTRTMPPGSLEQITFRLAILHALVNSGKAVINPPAALEIAIDKFATLDRLARAGFPVPPTRVAQSRRDAIHAFHELGSDCVVKPLFGGEGKGVMRIQDEQLAWYTFATMEQLNSVYYVQKFMPPGGNDRRYLVIGQRVFAYHRENDQQFRTNVSAGGRTTRFAASDDECQRAIDAVKTIGLSIGAVDFIESDEGPMLLEVNGIPGWKGAQSVTDENLAECMMNCVLQSDSCGQYSEDGGCAIG